MTGAAADPLTGKWRIVEMALWDNDFVDMIEPAFLTFDDKGSGEFRFGAVIGGLECEYGERAICFTWEGFDEMDKTHGSGSVELEDDGTLSGEICFHHGDQSVFTGRRW